MLKDVFGFISNVCYSCYMSELWNKRQVRLPCFEGWRCSIESEKCNAVTVQLLRSFGQVSLFVKSGCRDEKQKNLHHFPSFSTWQIISG